MDALSEFLRVVHLVGAIFIHGRFSAPWCYLSPPAESAAPVLQPNADRVVIFHMLLEGECVVEVPGEPEVCLRAGDVVLFTGGDAHRMASGADVPAAPGTPLKELLARRPRALSYGGGGAVTRMVCGYLACDRRVAALLLSGLPRVLVVNVRGSNAGAWLETSVRYALTEARAPRPGGNAVLAKLAEVLIIEVLRMYTNEQSSGRTGWLAGLRDRLVSAALNAMHADPARAWTLEQLAREAGTSRSVLAERFQHLVGCAPMHYLTQWRLMMAANLLGSTTTPLTRIAEDVGYKTDSAFSRAFRREYGSPPSAYRRARAVA